MTKTITKDDKSINYQIIVKRNKHTYFRIKDNLVVITTNKYVKKSDIITLLMNNFDSIYHKISEKPQVLASEFLLFGQIYQLRIVESEIFRYEILNHQLTIYLPNNDNLQDVKDRIYQLELTNKITILEPLVSAKIKNFGLKIVPFKIKKVRSYHGKCYFKKPEIIYNLNLAKLDLIFLEYVIYHEYAHLVVHNHSKEFYQVLKELMPNYKLVQKKLSKIQV